MDQSAIRQNNSTRVAGEAAECSARRRTAPVFVMGCHRSGTNLLYDMLLSAGGFAVYRGYLPVYKMLIPRFGSLDKFSNRRRLMQTWLRSKGFRRSGLDGSQLTASILQGCGTGGDFIRIVMDEIARQQKVSRWAVYDPDNVLHVAKIKADIPNALFVHIIRDGRDITLSLKKMGGFRPLPWDRGSRSLLATAMYWEWMVRKGQQYGRAIPRDYIEVHYEDLVRDPRPTLNFLGEFLDHDLDYDRILSRGLGRLSESNSSFLEEAEAATTQPVNRWKERLSLDQIAALESLVGRTLQNLGYELTHETARVDFLKKYLRTVYPTFLDVKLWLKLNTPLGRLSNLSALELSSALSEHTK